MTTTWIDKLPKNDRERISMMAQIIGGLRVRYNISNEEMLEVANIMLKGETYFAYKKE